MSLILQALTRDDVLALRGDLSPYLIHLTRSGTCLLKADAFEGLSMDQILKLDARDSLIKIIDEKKLKARQAFGYFNYKVNVRRPNGTFTNPNSQIDRSWLKAVCFTETPVDHVHIQCKKILGRSLQFEPYGLAFFEACVRPRVNPVFYFDSSNTSLKSVFDGIAQDTMMQKLVDGRQKIRYCLKAETPTFMGTCSKTQLILLIRMVNMQLHRQLVLVSVLE